VLARAETVTDAAERARLLVDAEELCREAAQQLRTLAYVLHPPALGRGLVAGIRSCADGFASRSGIQTTFRHADPGELPDAVELALFRIVQEALSNVQRHAGAHTVEIELWRAEERVEVIVRDDGRGLSEAVPFGTGMTSMRERVRILGGSLEARGVPGRTEIHATVPVPVRGPAA